MAVEHGSGTLYRSSRVILRRLRVEDQSEFVELVKLSTDFLHPWVYLPNTSAKFDEYLQRFDGDMAEALLICIQRSGEIAGTVSISDIIRGPYQRATVGYNAFMPKAGQGYMSEGFKLIFRFAFEDLNLHRLEADIQPENATSLEFARRVGFRREGYSPGFVFIDGSWRDHERWAINSDMIRVPAEAEVAR
jgi:[ribosomal protein S5]-alanine N-acetyltransferase